MKSYVIERYINSVPHYLGPRKNIVWEKRIEKALKFSEQDCAATYLNSQFDGVGNVIEYREVIPQLS